MVGAMGRHHLTREQFHAPETRCISMSGSLLRLGTDEHVEPKEFSVSAVELGPLFTQEDIASTSLGQWEDNNSLFPAKDAPRHGLTENRMFDGHTVFAELPGCRAGNKVFLRGFGNIVTKR